MRYNVYLMPGNTLVGDYGAIKSALSKVSLPSYGNYLELRCNDQTILIYEPQYQDWFSAADRVEQTKWWIPLSGIPGRAANKKRKR